jgi:hypothetical protein
MPVAIDQAGAYIQKLGIPLESYLSIFEASFEETMAKKPAFATWQYRDDTVFTTWEISFKAVANENVKAAELMILCSFLSNDDISIDMLSRGWSPLRGKGRLPIVFYWIWKLTPFSSRTK